jgi:Zn-dependent peptidase ImmA (M78 family)
MKSPIVPSEEAKAIESRVDRLLKDLGRPKPPVNLVQVRAIQKLDVRYYSLSNPDFLDRMAHKMRVAGKVIAPIRLWQAFKQMALKAALLPDAKKILIDDDLHDIKKRWAEAHEITHDLLDWHAGYMYGDSEVELLPSCQDMMEAEANLGAGLLLFPRYYLDDYLSGKEPLMNVALALAEESGNSITAAGWRIAEHATRPTFFMVCDSGTMNDASLKHLAVSPTFEQRFGHIQPSQLFTIVKANARRARGGPLGTFTYALRDADGRQHEFVFDVFGIGGLSILAIGYTKG